MRIRSKQLSQSTLSSQLETQRKAIAVINEHVTRLKQHLKSLQAITLYDMYVKQGIREYQYAVILSSLIVSTVKCHHAIHNIVETVEATLTLNEARVQAIIQEMQER